MLWHWWSQQRKPTGVLQHTPVGQQNPPPQSMPHWPTQHTPLEQTFPHAPQFDGSLFVFTQEPLQLVKPGEQVTTGTHEVVSLPGGQHCAAIVTAAEHERCPPSAYDV